MLLLALGKVEIFFFICIQKYTLDPFRREFQGNLYSLAVEQQQQQKEVSKPTTSFSPPVRAGSAVLVALRICLSSPNKRPPPTAAAQLPCPGEPRCPTLTGVGFPPPRPGETSPRGGEAREERQKVSSGGLWPEPPALQPSSGRRRGEAHAAPSPQGPSCPRRARHRGQVAALPPSPRTPLPALLSGRGRFASRLRAASVPTHRHGPAGSPG